MKKTVALMIFFCMVFSLLAVSASAETKWPEKPVTIIVPYNPGGDSDTTARILADKLTEKTGQSFIVQNVAGNSGAIGVRQALESDPDGYTIGYMHTAFLINYFAGASDLTYDDMTFGAIVGIYDSAKITTMVCNPDLGISKASELMAYTKEHPGELLYGSCAGTTAYVLGLKMVESGFDVLVVDTGDAAERQAAILGKHIDIVHMPKTTAKDYIESGDLVEVEDDIGLDINCNPYYQMNFPKGTDPEIVAKLNELLEDIILHDEDYAKRIYDAYMMEPFYMNSEDGYKFIMDLWEQYKSWDWG